MSLLAKWTGSYGSRLLRTLSMNSGKQAPTAKQARQSGTSRSSGTEARSKAGRAGTSTRYLAQLAAELQQSPIVQRQFQMHEEFGNSLRSQRGLAQQKATAQRAAESGHWIAEAASSGGPAAHLSKERFLSELRSRVTRIAESVLARVGLSAANCPYIPYWFQYYLGKDAAHIEKALRRYAPEAEAAASPMEFLDLVSEHVRQAFEQHILNGSLEGVPEEIPRNLDEKGPRTAGSEKVIQGCFDCFRTSPEQAPLISGASRGRRGPDIPVLEAPSFDVGAPEVGSQVDLSDWTQHGAQIVGGYQVYYRIDGSNYNVIATTGPGLGNRATVVANSYLESAPRDSKTIYFTSFGSNPPFSGLGGIALDLLRQQSGLILVPKGPVFGAYTAYHKMGMTGFVIPESALLAVGELVAEAKQIKSSLDFDIAREEDRQELRAIQERIKQVEQRYGMKNLLKYVGPD